MTTTSDLTGDLNPDDARLYLLSRGWRPESRSRVAMLLRDERGEDELLLPLRQDASDFPRRWKEFLAGVAERDRTSPEAVAEAILYAGADIAEWRASGAAPNDFTLPLSDAERIIRGAREAVVAAASATILRRGYFGRSKPKQAREHAGAVRMGQTRRGSYIIPIISRVPALEPDISPADAEARLDVQTTIQPFERQVMTRLAESLSAVHELAVQADSAPSMRLINEAVELGVSAELCSSVAGVLEADSVTELDVSFSWSSRLAQRMDAPREIIFPREAGALVKRIADGLRGSDVVASQQLVGYVVELHRGEDDEVGVVTVRAETGRVKRLVKMALDPTAYEQATQANNERRPVLVTGTLHREPGKAYRLEDVTNFGYAQFMLATE